LDSIKEQDPEMWKRLTTPVEEDQKLFKQYKYICVSGSLYQVITKSIQEQEFYPGFSANLVMEGNSPIGFLSYFKDEKSKAISRIKMFSFFDTGNIKNTLVYKELSKLVFQYNNSYNISWVADPGNPEKEVYDFILTEFGC
jgi:hypothetical protein